jgi:hypothetical protein
VQSIKPYPKEQSESGRKEIPDHRHKSLYIRSSMFYKCRSHCESAAGMERVPDSQVHR